MVEYDEKERDDIWTAIDNLQSAISLLKDHLEDELEDEALRYLEQYIEAVVELI